MYHSDTVNLDNESGMQQVDTQNMLQTATDFPHHMHNAWLLGDKIPLDFSFQGTEIVVCGMGGSAIGGTMLRSLLAPQADVPILVNRSYDLPAFVDENSLVVTISYSGNTEETLTCFHQAIKRGSTTITASSGGQLGDSAERADLNINIPTGMQPRAALPLLIIPIARIMERLNITPPLGIPESIQTVSDLLTSVGPSAPTASNQAKQIALLLTAPVILYGFDVMAAAATRWRQQLNENTKMVAFDFALPEANHNELMAWEHTPPEHVTCIFLRGPQDHDWVTKRFSFMTDVYRPAAQVINVNAAGPTPLAQLMYAVHLGDMVSIYAALARDIDPAPVKLIDELKRFLAPAGGK